MEEEFGELLFALSSSDRMKLLSEIQGGDLRLTDLSERLSATAQETSKHLMRLVDSRVIEKSAAGSYRLTSFGRVIMETIPSLGFVSRYRKYFLSHDISFLPQQFVLRLGELTEHLFVDHVTNVLTECQHLLGLAEDYFLWTVDQPLPWTLLKPLPDKLSARFIVPSAVAPESYQKAKEILGVRSEARFAAEVKVGIAVNEKMAGICFCDLDGRIDFASGFIGYSQSFQRWCYDLFTYLWERASPDGPRGSQQRKGGHRPMRGGGVTKKREEKQRHEGSSSSPLFRG